MSYTLSRKIGIVGVTYYSAESARPSEADLDKQNKADALKVTPALVAIADKISPKELYARSRIISKLGEMSNNREKTFGTIKSKTLSGGVDGAIKNLNEVIAKLTSETDITKLGDNSSINAWFLGWDGPGDTNIAVLNPTKMTYRKFLSNVVDDSQLVASLFTGNEKVSEGPETEEIRQRTRLGTFLVALENKHPDAEYKTMFRLAHEALAKRDINGAKDIVRKTIKKEWNIEISAVIDKDDHPKTLRAIGATAESGKVVVQSTKELLDKKDGLNEKQKALVTELKTRFEGEKSGNMAIANQKYTEMLNAIPKSDPYRAQVERGKTQIIEELANEKAYMTILDGYMGKNGSDGLGELYDMYNDMKGLKGFWNFSDENAKMTKEMAIMVASMALTAGIGPILGGIGIGARALAGANVVRATTLAADASKFKTGINAVSNASKAVARGALVGTARVAEAGLTANNALTAEKLGDKAAAIVKTGAEASKFTTIDALIRSATREIGDQSGFKDFADKLVMNGVMFGAFGGMEKFVSGPALAKITQKFGIIKGVDDAGKNIYGFKNGATTLAVDGAILTTGDIIVMQALHGAETGEWDHWDWMSAYQALAFRVGMKGTEKVLPKLTAKFNESKLGKNIVERAEMQKNGITIVDGKRVSLGVADEATLATNAALEPQARIAKAGELLGRKLNEVEQGALLKAHDYNIEDIVAKGKALMGSKKKPIFTREEAKILIDQKLAGKGSNKDLPKYHGEADKVIISKSNKSDLPKFQQEGYDLTQHGFEGWNIKQSQNKGDVTYTLTHAEHGTHTFKTPKEVQEFLKNPNAPKEVIPNTPSKLSEERGVATQTIDGAMNRKAFDGLSVGVDGNIHMSLDSLGLPGMEITKFKNSGHSEKQYLISGDRNLYSLQEAKGVIAQLQAKKGVQKIENNSPSRSESPSAVELPKNIDTVINGVQGVPKQEQLRNFLNNAPKNNLLLLDNLGLQGWKVQKLPQGNARNNNVYELTIPGKEPMRIEGKKNLMKEINNQSRNLAETIPVKEPSILTQPKDAIIPQNESRSELKQLQDRRDEILAWKKENPGNIRHDADLMVTETAIAKMAGRIQKPENLTGNQGNDRTPSQSATTDKSTNVPKSDQKPMGSDLVENNKQSSINSKTDLIPAGRHNDRLMIDGQEFRYSDKQQGWTRGNGDGTFTLIKPSGGNTIVAGERGSQQGTGDKQVLRIEDMRSVSQKSAAESAEVFSSQSFRKEIESLMSLDDATFQVRYTKLMSRGNIRMYEREMLEGVANVRKLTDKQILEKAKGDITTNRQAMGENRPKKLTEAQAENLEKAILKTEGDITKMKKDLVTMESEQKDLMIRSTHGEDPVAADLYNKNQKIIDKKMADIAQAEKYLDGLNVDRGMSRSEKALIVAENAALRYRLKNMLTREGMPTEIIEASPDRKKFLDNFDKKWLFLSPLLLLLHSSQGNSTPTPLPDNPTVDDLYASCASCYNKDAIPVRQNRKINGREANDVYRIGVSERWIKTRDWKDLIKLYNTNKPAIQSQNPTMITAMDALIGTNGKITVDGVQNIQHCIAMLDSKTNTSTDSQSSQDGMLGPITTKALSEYFTNCSIKK